MRRRRSPRPGVPRCGHSRGRRRRSADRGPAMAPPTVAPAFATAADLVAEDSADDPAEDRAAGIGLAHCLALDPAAPLGQPDHGVHRCDRDFEHALLRPAPVFIGRCGHWRGRLILVVPPRIRRADRRDAVVHAHRGQRFVASGAKQDAPATEARVLASFPAPAIHHRRRGAVVESSALKLGTGRRERGRVAFAFAGSPAAACVAARGRAPAGIGGRKHSHGLLGTMPLGPSSACSQIWPRRLHAPPGPRRSPR